MNYILTENKNVLLGPITWKPRFFQSELDDLEINFTVPPIEGYIQISDTIEIIPVLGTNIPGHNDVFQQLVGPFYTFTDNTATGYYTLMDLDVEHSKQKLKDIIANTRWNLENAGVQVTIREQQITCDTSRDGRNVYAIKYQLMADTDLTRFKFPECWLILTKAELGSIVAAGDTYIQTQYDLEHAKTIEIENCTTIDGLRAIVINNNLDNKVPVITTNTPLPGG